MSDLKLEVITDTVKNVDTITLIQNGRPHVYWLNLYRDLGISAAHADNVLSKLKEGLHYIKLSRSEIKDKMSGINASLILSRIPAVRSYYFINDEGWNRAIIAIETNSMLNREAADYIEEIKTRMANIYTRYQRGETLQLPGTNQDIPTITGKVDQVLDAHLDIAQSLIRRGADKEKAYGHALDASITATGFISLEHYRDIILTLPAPSELPVIEDISKGWYTTSTISKSLGKSRKTIYDILISWGYMVLRGGIHVVTDEGKSHGRMFETSYQGLKSSGVKQNWYWDQVTYDHIEREIENRAGQMTLTGEKACTVSA